MNKVKKTCIIFLAAVAVLAVTLSAVLYATRDRGCFSSVIIWCDQDPPTTYEQAILILQGMWRSRALPAL